MAVSLPKKGKTGRAFKNFFPPAAAFFTSKVPF
jgi:hypothetical protein